MPRGRSFSASADGIAVIVNFFEQSVGDDVAVSSHEHEDLGEEFAVVAADAVGGQALVLSIDAGDEQAVELVLADELDSLQKIELTNTLIERNSVMALKPESRKGIDHVAL